MGLQGYIGLGISFENFMGFEGLRAIFWLFIFLLLFALLGKSWCGWVCPLGLVSDYLTKFRRFLGVKGINFSQSTLKRLRPIKYILLSYLLLGPVLINLGWLHPDFYLPFCQICPGKALLPIFEGQGQYLALDMTNPVTITQSAFLVALTAVTVVGLFFRERFFCLFCPMLAIFNLLKPLAALRLIKTPKVCRGCASCRRVCPMEVGEVYEERLNAYVAAPECLGCGDCLVSCPSENSLSLSFLGRKVVSSSRR
jgi:polyferredoxin